MQNSNWLANIFEYIGEVFEKFNPSAYRFLAAVLPYLTPLPVAWLTASSASQFLNFPPNIAFVFVFALEGVGLWFTGLLVDAVVDWIRSRNIKTFAMVIIFGVVVSVYVIILVSLNVTLESAFGNANPTISKVITLMCFLPLLSGVGNGYYKLKLDYRTESERLRKEQILQEDKIRAERSQERLEKYKIRHGNFPIPVETFQKDVESFQKVSNETRKFPESFYGVSSWRKLSSKLSNEDLIWLASLEPREMQSLSEEIGKDYRTISNWRSAARQLLEEENENV